MSRITLNPDQRQGVDRMHEFAAGPEPFFLLEGSAGTGKTTCVQTFVRETRCRVCLTAPTNKATKVLREMAAQELDDDVSSRTIYSLLGLRLEANGEVRTLSAFEEGNRADAYDVVVVDEGSMCNAALMGHIRRTAHECQVKFLFMADEAQLPPVGEERSQVFDIAYRHRLTKVERHDNQILTLANHIREVQAGLVPLSITTNCDESGGVYVCHWRKMRERACQAFTSESYQANPGSIKLIAWRNATVQAYNEQIREAMYGRKVAEESPFQVGERVVTCQPIYLQGELQMATDEEGTVEQIEVCQHPVFGHLTCYELQIAPEFGGAWVTSWVIHEKSARQHAALLGDLANRAKARQGSWQAFWDAKEAIHDIRPCHAITAHRAQGSTYETTFIDVGDILANRTRKEALQCLYVGATRPRRILVACGVPGGTLA